MKQRNFHLSILFVLYLISTSCFAQKQKDTLNVLFVGNSYTYFHNMPHLVSIISNDTKTKLITKKSTVGGATFREHWFGEKKLKTKEIINNGKFDIVVLQEYSLGAIKQPDSLMKYGKMLCDLIKKSNATPYLYLTWPREKTPETRKIINSVYSKFAKENNAIIVPVSDAWAIANQIDSKVNLYAKDGSHPSKIGAYITAAVFTKFLSNENLRLKKMAFKIRDYQGESIELMRIYREEELFSTEVINKVNLN